MNIKFSAALVLSLVSFGVDGETGIMGSIDPKEINLFHIESSSGSLAEIHVGMSESDLTSLKYSLTRRSIVMEGDEYDVVDVLIKNLASVECVLDSGRLERFSTLSNLVRDEKNIGVGSTLSELKSAYPKGKVLVGDEDGRYANFVNGSRVIFEVDQNGIDSRCFESSQRVCDLDSSAKVVRVTVNLNPVSLLR